MFKFKTEELTQIKEFCQQYQVAKFYLFGSSTGTNFDTNRSDLDFLVEFKKMTPTNHAESYFSLKEALVNLFQRSIDLIEYKAINNPYLLKQINQEKIIIYE